MTELMAVTELLAVAELYLQPREPGPVAVAVTELLAVAGMGVEASKNDPLPDHALRNAELHSDCNKGLSLCQGLQQDMRPRQNYLKRALHFRQIADNEQMPALRPNRTRLSGRCTTPDSRTKH